MTNSMRRQEEQCDTTIVRKKGIVKLNVKASVLRIYHRHGLLHGVGCAYLYIDCAYNTSPINFGLGSRLNTCIL